MQAEGRFFHMAKHRHFVAAIFLTLAPTFAAAQQGALAGKTINMIIGYPPGGGYDSYGRLFAAHFGRHVLGNPAVVTRNMPGAGSLRAANHLFNAAARDGTDLGMFATSIALEPLFGGQSVHFDPRSFTWIGNMMQDASNIAVSRSSAITNWRDMRGRETVFGATGPGSISSIHVTVAGTLLGLKTRIIHGFPGTKDGVLAMERGEIDAYAGLYVSTLKTAYWSSVVRGDMKVVLQLGRSASSELGEAPSIFSLLQSEEDRQVAGVIFDQDRIGRPVAAPPQLDPAIADVLRKAFQAMTSDADFLAMASKAGAPIDAQSGQEVAEAFNRFYSYPPEIINRAKALMSR